MKTIPFWGIAWEFPIEGAAPVEVYGYFENFIAWDTHLTIVYMKIMDRLNEFFLLVFPLDIFRTFVCGNALLINLKPFSA